MRRNGVGMAGKRWSRATAGVLLLSAIGLGGTWAQAQDRDGPDPVVELGRRLFFDPAVSQSGVNSCASCHDPEHGFSSQRIRDDDDFLVTPRHSQTLLDAADGRAFHWDGEFDSVEQLVAARMLGGLRPRSEARGAPSAKGSPSSADSDAAEPTAAAPALRTGGMDPSMPSLLVPNSDPRLGPGTVVGGYYGEPPPVIPPPPTVEPTPTPTPSTPTPTTPPPSTPPTAPPQAGPATTDPGAPVRRDSKGRAEPVALRVDRDGRYAQSFRAAYGSPRASTSRIAQSIAAYVDSIRSTTSPYDLFARGDSSALSPAARRGLDLFRGRAGCVRCHAMDGDRAAFTDRQFHDTGIALRATLTPTFTADGRGAIAAVDVGRSRWSRVPAEKASFKTPTLRDVALRPPYMHDGSFATLADVVRYYARGGIADPHLDPQVRPFDATPRDVDDLVAFLESLTGEVRPGLAPRGTPRAQRTVLRLLDAKGAPLAGVGLRLVPAGDRLPGEITGEDATPDRTIALSTDEDGRAEFLPSRRTHVRVEIAGGVRPMQGEWIPDTCASLQWKLPVEGRASLLVISPADAIAARRLIASEDVVPLSPSLRAALAEFYPRLLDAQRHRVTTFTSDGTAVLPSRTLTRYWAWIPVGSPRRVVVDIPTANGRVPCDVRLEDGATTRVELTP